MPVKKPAAVKKEVGPVVSEFLQCCKVVGFQDDDVINQVSNFLGRSETHIRLVNLHVSAALWKALLRLFQRYQRLQQVIFYNCLISEVGLFFKQFSAEFPKCAANSLSLDYMPLQRDVIHPLLATQTLDVLSLRGNQCLTSYNFVTHERRAFPQSLNAFFNALTTSAV
jgi:hypothetical protein